MPVQCAHCGEELLGAVNRCWRCGHPFAARPGPSQAPPVRRAPVQGPFDGLVTAEVVGEDAAGDSEGSTQARAIRRGSPFAECKATAGESAIPPTGRPWRGSAAPATRSDYRRHAGASAGGIVAILLGLTSLFVGFGSPLGAMITASVGVGMGSWGLYSPRRGVAILGLLLCCLALAVAGFYGVVDLYTYLYGASPWETVEPAATE